MLQAHATTCSSRSSSDASQRRPPQALTEAVVRRARDELRRARGAHALLAHPRVGLLRGGSTGRSNSRGALGLQQG